MDYKQHVFSLIAQLTGQSNIITVNVALVNFVDDFETGLFLSQLIYWSDRGTRKDGFFYKTDEEWQQEIMLSQYSIRKARRRLEKMGLLETKVMKANGSPTVHYRFNKSRFSDLFISFLRNQKNEIADSKERSFENESSLTEITTETTTEINNISIPFSEIIEYLNSRADTNYKSGTKKTKDLIKARWNEEFKLEDFKRVIDNKVTEWINDPNMNKYLRPETLFGTKFEAYLNQKGGVQNGKGQTTNPDEWDFDF
ncbi:conserved phage C-terminal domain-containing protein [Bacillus sp. 1P06AnD]|uniref:conserved phage C-terminal domain-containing protein n=1 Tax=Bacillus sp. 1P06AnD TaxID=3132208 RepID=UPI00399FC326